MRTMPTGVDTLLAAVSRAHHQRVWVGPPGEALVDMTDYLIPGTIHEEGINEPVDMLVLHFDRSLGSSSLSPLMTADPPIDLNFDVVWEVAVTDQVTAPGSGDWIEKFRGTVWDIDATNNNMVVTCQGQAGRLNERLTLAGQTIAAGTGLEDAIQAVLDGPTPSLGVTLEVPVTPDASLDQTLEVTHQSVLRAALDLAGSIGWVARYWWSESDGEFRFTLMEPPRDKTVADWSTSASRYIAVPEFRRSKADVRNSVIVFYGAVDGSGDQAFVTAEDEDSIDEFGLLESVFREGSDSPLQTQAQAQAFADAFISDMAWPDITHSITDFDLPNIELWDLIELAANDVHYNTTQSYAVQSIRREFPAMGVARITLGLRGKPSAGVGTWRRRMVVAPQQGPPGGQGPPGEPGDESANVLELIRSGPVAGVYQYVVKLGADVAWAMHQRHVFTGNPPSNYTDTVRGTDPIDVNLQNGDVITCPEPEDGSNQVIKGIVTPYGDDDLPCGKGQEYELKAEVDWQAIEQAAADATAAAAGAPATADGKVTTFFQNDAPTAEGEGDLWVDTNDSNKLYRWDGDSWESVRDAGIAQAISDAADAQETADGKIVTFYQNDPPTAEGVGDIWIETDDNNEPHRWDGSNWISIRDGRIAEVESELTALISPLGAILRGTSNPTTRPGGSALVTGDLLIRTDQGSRVYQWDGDSWEAAETTIDGGRITTGEIQTGVLFSGEVTGITGDFSQLTVKDWLRSDNFVDGVSGYELTDTGGQINADVAIRATLTIDTEGIGNSIDFAYDGVPIGAISTSPDTIQLIGAGSGIDLGVQLGISSGDDIVLFASGDLIFTAGTNGYLLHGLPTTNPGGTDRLWRNGFVLNIT